MVREKYRPFQQYREEHRLCQAFPGGSQQTCQERPRQYQQFQDIQSDRLSQTEVLIIISSLPPSPLPPSM